MSSKSLVMRVSRSPTDLRVTDIDENDLKAGGRLVGLVVLVVVAVSAT